MAGALRLLPHRRRPAAYGLIFQFSNHRSTIDDLDQFSLFRALAGHSEGRHAARWSRGGNRPCALDHGKEAPEM
jgi:hypothetical protein